MINLKNKDTGQKIGSITEAQLQYLIDELVEEHQKDQDYWLNRRQLEIFKEKGGDAALISMLESAMGSHDDIEVIWERS